MNVVSGGEIYSLVYHTQQERRSAAGKTRGSAFFSDFCLAWNQERVVYCCALLCGRFCPWRWLRIVVPLWGPAFGLEPASRRTQCLTVECTSPGEVASAFLRDEPYALPAAPDTAVQLLLLSYLVHGGPRNADGCKCQEGPISSHPQAVTFSLHTKGSVFVIGRKVRQK